MDGKGSGSALTCPGRAAVAPHIIHRHCQLLQQPWAGPLLLGCLASTSPQRKSTALSLAPDPGASAKHPLLLSAFIPHTRYSVSRINFIIVFSKTILQHVVLYPYAFWKCNTKNDEMIYNSYLFLLRANSVLYLGKHSPRQVNRMYFSTVV